MKHFDPEPYRYKRQGFPEAIYCPGKTSTQIVAIAGELLSGDGPVMATRADSKVYSALKKKFPHSVHYPAARIVHVKKRAGKIMIAHPDRFICVLTAGTTDIPVAEEAAVTASILGNRVERVYDAGVAGVHRLIGRRELIRAATCVIACAGMEGALASVAGGLANCPVIGVPTSVGYGTAFGGITPLLTMLNSCAANVSVVNIDDGFGAGIIAGLINKK
ncbi:MAG: hypothetical protein A2314_08410 [Elusimicrobia bacterium RIFOXYB2_FULL_50_12]|nr:MAG: hypothetical protein A2314_08410 [Elusimicrobia bacterium RIFOXYB2_FULL_50_12]